MNPYLISNDMRLDGKNSPLQNNCIQGIKAATDGQVCICEYCTQFVSYVTKEPYIITFRRLNCRPLTYNVNNLKGKKGEYL